MPVDCICSHDPGNAPGLVSRSEEKAIHLPSGDHAGRKFPDRLAVRLRTVLLARSISQMFAVPPPRVETKARVLPSGEIVPWSSNAGSSVSCSSPEPSGCTRKMSAWPLLSRVTTIHLPSDVYDGE